MKTKNKCPKYNSRHLDIFGVKFCIPKGSRQKINKEYPEKKGKKLDIKDLSKIKKCFKKKQE